MTENTSPAAAPAVPPVPVQGSPATTCSTCGATAASEPPPLTWSAGVERGVRVWSCERCMRENLRSIEGKLDSPWW